MCKKNALYDIRAIRIIKSTKRRPLASFLETDASFWICLGHFDIMEINQLASGAQSQKPLDAIRKDSQSYRCIARTENTLETIEENYGYQLYVLRQFGEDEVDQEKKRLQTFWEIDTNFLIVARFHCDRINGSNSTEPFSEILAKRCESKERHGIIDRATNDSGKGFIKLKVSPVNRERTGAIDVMVTFYESLELGDIVGIIKSNSLSAILEVQRHLYETDEVRDAYTYCGIDRKLFGKSAQNVKNLLQRRENIHKNTFLDYVSTRFSINDTKNADTFIKENFSDVQEKFFAIGTADAVINQGKCTEKQFLDTMRRIVHSTSSMYNSFNDIITRVGLCYRSPAPSKKGNLQFKRVAFCESIPNYQDILNDFYKKDYSWSYSLMKLLGTLRTMYENCVMDDLSDLLVPGVRALLERISHLDKNNLWRERDHEDVWEFLEYWTSLTSDITHLESQLVQHPELTSIRYYIPAMILRFEQKLVNSYVEIIHKLDQSEVTDSQKRPRTFGPILFICSEERVSTQCFLDPEYDTSYVGSSPLGIFVPVHRLYQPWEIAHILCHEIAHYCGDYLRNRKKRLDCLTESAAAFLLAELAVYLKSPYEKATIPQERNFQKKIVERIKRQYPSQDESESTYLKFVSEKLPSSVMKVGYHQKNLEEYQNIIWGMQSPQEQLNHIFAVNKMNTMEAGVIIEKQCRDHILNCLIPLYKECYADIVMILVLNCNFSDYYRCVYAEEYELNSQNVAASEHHTDRMALVGLALHTIEKEPKWELDSFKENSWVQAAKEKIDAWEKVSQVPEASEYRWLRKYLGKKKLSDGSVVETLNKYTLLADEAAQLLSYLEECTRIIWDQLKSAEEKSADVFQKLVAVRRYVCSAKDDTFNWNEMRTFLEQ